LAIAMAACSDDDEGKDNADAAATDESTDTGEGADTPTGADADGPLPCPAPPVAKGKVRARPLACAGELPKGAMAAAQVGDLVLENSVARFVIRKRAEGEAVVGLVGGNVIDAVRVAPDGKQIGVDSLREWVPIVAMYLVKPDKIEVTKDGKDGTAIVRVSGALTPFPTVFAFLSLDPPDATVAHEYRLGPDSTALEIRTIITPTKGKLDSPLVGDATFWGGQLGIYFPGSGDEDSGISPTGTAKFFGMAPMRADPLLVPAAVGFAREVSSFNAGGILAFIQPKGVVTDKGGTIIRHLVVGGDGKPQLAAAMAAASKLSGAKNGTLEGTVSGMWAGVEVELVDAKDKPLSRCMPDAKGAFTCPAPATTRGARALWIGNGAGQGGGPAQVGKVVKVKVDAGKNATVKLDAPQPAKLTIAARSAAGDKIPFQVRLLPGPGMKSGDRVFVDGDGDATFLLPAGAWTAWLYHGPEWSIHSETVTLVAGKEAKISATLNHVVDTTGWIAADTHIHAEHSSDSDIPNRERVLDAVAVSLDYAVATDHDYVTDYTPFLKAAGIEGKITVASGVEVSTAKYGHHGVWPITIDRQKSGNNAPQWHEKDGAGLVDAMRGGDSKRIWQVNHPRGSQSYFDGVDYTPKDAAKVDKKLLSFDAVELINSKRMDDTEEVLVDWFGLLENGYKPTAVATSDTHSLSAGVGSARTWIWIGKGKDGKGLDRQGKFTAAQADAALKAGKAVASTGPLMVLELMAGEATRTVGETLKGAKGNVTARVTITAPAWMPLGKVTIFRNGTEVHSAKLGQIPPKGGIRMVATSISAKAAVKAGWWTAVLRPAEQAGNPPVQRRPVYAISNPVYEAP